jgi:uncharacterized membrane protein
MPDDAVSLDELRTIRRMIAGTRRSTVRHWVYLLVWGVLGVVASVASQLLVETSHERQLWLVWTLYVVLGAAASALFGRRERERTRVLTFVGRTLSVTWIAIGVTIALVSVWTLVFETLPPLLLPGVIALLLAIGLCVMGALLEFRGLFFAAVLWWVGGLVMLLRPRDAYAVQTALLILGYLLPAEILRRQLADDDTLD